MNGRICRHYRRSGREDQICCGCGRAIASYRVKFLGGCPKRIARPCPCLGAPMHTAPSTSPSNYGRGRPCALALRLGDSVPDIPPSNYGRGRPCACPLSSPFWLTSAMLANQIRCDCTGGCGFDFRGLYPYTVRYQVFAVDLPRSSRGPGHHPLKVETGVRLPYGVQEREIPLSSAGFSFCLRTVGNAAQP